MMSISTCLSHNRISDILKIALLASILVGFSFWLQGNIGINLADEGRLWYNTTRTALGEIPRRDFRSYDPARLYWTAGWSLIFGDGLMALRRSVAFFQIVGLTFGLLTLRRIIRSWWMMSCAGLLLLVWMSPRWKIFEHSLAMAAVYFAVFLFEKPSLRRHFTAGVFVGAAAFFGRNHGLYTCLSFFLLILFIWLKVERVELLKRIGIWSIGIVIGYSPMLFMFIFIPGFFESFIQNILFILQRESANIPLPIPWPWTVNFSGAKALAAIKFISTGGFFLILPVFYGLTGIYLIWPQRNALKQKAVIIASVFVGVTYMHHAFGRADINHLAQAIHPLLIGFLSLPFICNRFYTRIISAGFLIVIYILSYFSVIMVSPYYRKLTAPAGSFVQLDIHGDNLWVSKGIGNIIQSVRRIHSQKIHPDEGLLIAPHWPGLYPILQRKSPLWDTYFLWKAEEDEQRQQISDLEVHNVNWIILGDVALDGRDDLRFRNTHTLLWRYILEHFESVQFDGPPKAYQLLKRKSQHDL